MLVCNPSFLSKGAHLGLQPSLTGSRLQLLWAFNVNTTPVTLQEASRPSVSYWNC